MRHPLASGGAGATAGLQVVGNYSSTSLGHYSTVAEICKGLSRLVLPPAERAAVGLAGEMSASRVLCYHPPMPTVYELGLIVGAAVGGGALAAVVTARALVRTIFA